MASSSGKPMTPLMLRNMVRLEMLFPVMKFIVQTPFVVQPARTPSVAVLVQSMGSGSTACKVQLPAGVATASGATSDERKAGLSTTPRTNEENLKSLSAAAATILRTVGMS